MTFFISSWSLAKRNTISLLLFQLSKVGSQLFVIVIGEFVNKEVSVQEATKDEIRNFVNEVVQRFNPECIILFGSHVSDRTNADSDVDLLVVMDFEGRYRKQKA